MIAPSATRSYAPSRADASLVHDFRRVFERNYWLILSLPVLAVAAAIVFIVMATPVYEGVAVVRIDQERSNLAVLDALQELSTGSQINTEMAELRSRSRAEDVVEALHLNAELRKPRRVARARLFSDLRSTRTAPAAHYQLMRTAGGAFQLHGAGVSQVVRVGERVRVPGLSFVLAPAAAQHEQIELRVRSFFEAVRILRRHFGVARPDREANILEVHYEGTDKDLAQRVPNELARQFIVNRNEVRKTQARSTVRFLREQIDTLGVQLGAAEKGLLAFREKQRVISPQAEGETQVTRLVEFQADRDRLDAERRSLASILAQSGQTENVADVRRLIGFPTLLRNPAASELLRSVNELENQRAELLNNRTMADPDVSALTQRIRQADGQLRALTETHLEALTQQIASLDASLSQFTTELNRIPAKEIQLARLRRQTEVTEEIYTELQTRLQEAQIAAAVEDPSVRVLDPAIVPLRPIKPNKPLSLVLALLLGLLLGTAIAFAREQVDSTIRSREELQELSGSVPVLGMVPRIQLAGAQRRFGRRRLAVAGNGDLATDLRRTTAGRDARGPVAEAYRTLRTNIAFTQPDAPAKVLVVTSALPGEGKSTSACNLALTLAQQGLRVILIDGDMRRGTLHKALGAGDEPGMSNVMLGRVALSQALQHVELDGIGLDFLPTGTLPPNPAELLGSARAVQLLEDLKPSYDAVIVDSPPLNIVTDAAIIGSRADGVLLVARSGITERAAYRHALEQLEAVRARVLGCVLNDVSPSNAGYYGRKGAEYYVAHSAS
jgi:tyrosine-protein kinase Etk/Wzc